MSLVSGLLQRMPQIDKWHRKNILQVGKKIELMLDHYSNPLRSGEDYNLSVMVQDFSTDTNSYKFVGFAEHIDEGDKHDCSFSFEWKPQSNMIQFFQRENPVKSTVLKCSGYYHFLRTDHIIDYLFQNKPVQIFS